MATDFVDAQYAIEVRITYTVLGDDEKSIGTPTGSEKTAPAFAGTEKVVALFVEQFMQAMRSYQVQPLLVAPI